MLISLIALAPVPWGGVYTALKAAIHAIYDVLRLELRPFGIDVVCIVPGAIKSNLGKSVLASYNRMPEWKLYKQFREAIQARPTLSQSSKSSPSEEFANKTVDAVLKENAPAWFSLGHLSMIMAVMYHMPLLSEILSSGRSLASDIYWSVLLSCIILVRYKICYFSVASEFKKFPSHWGRES